MFRKTYYSRHDLDQALDNDLHWIEQAKAEFELGVFQTDSEGVKEKLEKTVAAWGFQLFTTETGEGIAGNRIILFLGHKKAEPASE